MSVIMAGVGLGQQRSPLVATIQTAVSSKRKWGLQWVGGVGQGSEYSWLMLFILKSNECDSNECHNGCGFAYICFSFWKNVNQFTMFHTALWLFNAIVCHLPPLACDKNSHVRQIRTPLSKTMRSQTMRRFYERWFPHVLADVKNIFTYASWEAIISSCLWRPAVCIYLAAWVVMFFFVCCRFLAFVSQFR